MQDEGRPGCVGYGQMRRYTIRTSKATDAGVAVHVHAQSALGIAAVYLSANTPPSEIRYDAMVERSSSGADARTLRLTASPCLLRRSNVWHILLALEPQAVALARGVTPSQFELSVHLENALLPRRNGAVAPRGGDDALVPAKGATGDGFACCGVFKYYLVRRGQRAARAHARARACSAPSAFRAARPTHVAAHAGPCAGRCRASRPTSR